MKKTLTIMLIILPSILMAQKYIIPIKEIGNGVKKNKNTLNKADINWIQDAKVIITGLQSQAEFDAIKLNKHKTNEEIKSAPYDNDGQKVFNVSDAIQNKVIAFDIFDKDKLVDTVTFNVKEKAVDEKNTNIEGDDDQLQAYVGALTGANFIGNNKFLANLTPIINLGTIVPLTSKGMFSWDLDVNPYIGGDIDSKDSVSFIPALMLPGKAGLILNNYLNFDLSGKTRLTVMAFGFGLKFITNLRDSAKTVIQNNIRFGISLKYSDAFVISGQYTYGTHILTSQSKENFKSIFGNHATDISYVTVTGQFAVKGKTDGVRNYIFLEWRALLNKSRYDAFTNNAILTLGIRKTLELGSGIFQANSKGGTRRSRIHSNF